MKPLKKSNAPSLPAPSPGTPREGRGEGLDLELSGGAEYVRYLRSHITAARVLLRPRLRHLSVALVNDAQMSQLHKRFLGVSGPTDVLTFELDHDSSGCVTSGEVIVCVAEARRQARERGSTVQKELLLYALHGMLHLIGFDDRTAAGYRSMHRKEDQILTQLGIGPVFAGEPRRGAKLEAR